MTSQVRAEIIRLAGHGFSYKVIRGQTGLSNSTIAKVLRQAGAQLYQYRDGRSQAAADLIRRCEVAINKCRQIRGLSPRRWR